MLCQTDMYSVKIVDLRDRTLGCVYRHFVTLCEGTIECLHMIARGTYFLYLPKKKR